MAAEQRGSYEGGAPQRPAGPGVQCSWRYCLPQRLHELRLHAIMEEEALRLAVVSPESLSGNDIEEVALGAPSPESFPSDASCLAGAEMAPGEREGVPREHASDLPGAEMAPGRTVSPEIPRTPRRSWAAPAAAMARLEEEIDGLKGPLRPACAHAVDEFHAVVDTAGTELQGQLRQPLKALSAASLFVMAASVFWFSHSGRRSSIGCCRRHSRRR